MDNSQLVENFIEVETLNTDRFLQVKETLTRIGIAAKRTSSEGNKPVLWQSCHILHKQGRYYIVHFKQLFLLDGKDNVTEFTDDDYTRTVMVANLLEEWGLVKLVKPLDKLNCIVTIIPFREKENWQLKPKYTIGQVH